MKTKFCVHQDVIKIKLNLQELTCKAKCSNKFKLVTASQYIYDSTYQVKGPPASPVHERDGDEGHDDHDGTNADGGVLSLVLDDARLQEEVRRVVEDRNHSGQLKEVKFIQIIKVNFRRTNFFV